MRKTWITLAMTFLSLNSTVLRAEDPELAIEKAECATAAENPEITPHWLETVATPSEDGPTPVAYGWRGESPATSSAREIAPTAFRDNLKETSRVLSAVLIETVRKNGHASASAITSEISAISRAGYFEQKEFAAQAFAEMERFLESDAGKALPYARATWETHRDVPGFREGMIEFLRETLADIADEGRAALGPRVYRATWWKTFWQGVRGKAALFSRDSNARGYAQWRYFGVTKYSLAGLMAISTLYSLIDAADWLPVSAPHPVEVVMSDDGLAHRYASRVTALGSSGARSPEVVDAFRRLVELQTPKAFELAAGAAYSGFTISTLSVNQAVSTATLTPEGARVILKAVQNEASLASSRTISPERANFFGALAERAAPLLSEAERTDLFVAYMRAAPKAAAYWIRSPLWSNSPFDLSQTRTFLLSNTAASRNVVGQLLQLQLGELGVIRAVIEKTSGLTDVRSPTNQQQIQVMIDAYLENQNPILQKELEDYISKEFAYWKQSYPATFETTAKPMIEALPRGPLRTRLETFLRPAR